MDKNSDIDCVFTDFSKAYDSIWHDGLIYKLNCYYNVNGPFLKCINCFLRSRYTRVLLKKGHSDWKLQDLGLPQGSSLSPILYMLYTNDYEVKYSNFVAMGCFADDTAFWTTPAPKSNLRYKMLQKEISRFHDWTKYWKLSLNPSKCKTLNIHKPRSQTIYHKYSLNNSILESVTEYKYLGLWLDKHLDFKTHVTKTYTKLQGSLYRVIQLTQVGYCSYFPKQSSKYTNVNQDLLLNMQAFSITIKTHITPYKNYKISLSDAHFLVGNLQTFNYYT